MKVGIITILSTLLFAFVALPALAGPPDPCDGQPDFDGDGLCDIIDNCSEIANASQTDGDQDGYGNACDCDFSPSQNNACDGADFGSLGGVFGTLVPPTNCEFDMATNGAVDGGDFAAFGAQFGNLPGPACTLAPGVGGVPCPTPGAVCP